MSETDQRTEKQKMLAGELYRPDDLELQADLAANQAWMAEYNAAAAKSVSERHELLLDELADPVRRGVLKLVFSDPERLRPNKTRAALTARTHAELDALLADLPATTEGSGPARAGLAPRAERGRADQAARRALRASSSAHSTVGNLSPNRLNHSVTCGISASHSSVSTRSTASTSTTDTRSPIHT